MITATPGSAHHTNKLLVLFHVCVLPPTPKSAAQAFNPLPSPPPFPPRLRALPSSEHFLFQCSFCYRKSNVFSVKPKFLAASERSVTPSGSALFSPGEGEWSNTTSTSPDFLESVLLHPKQFQRLFESGADSIETELHSLAGSTVSKLFIGPQLSHPPVFSFLIYVPTLGFGRLRRIMKKIRQALQDISNKSLHHHHHDHHSHMGMTPRTPLETLLHDLFSVIRPTKLVLPR